MEPRPAYWKPVSPITKAQFDGILHRKQRTAQTVDEIATDVGVTPYVVDRTAKQPLFKTRMKAFRDRLAKKHYHNAAEAAQIAAVALRELKHDLKPSIGPDGVLRPGKKLEPKEIRDLGWFSLASGKAASELLDGQLKDEELENDRELAALAETMLKQRSDAITVASTPHPLSQPVEEPL